MEFNRNTEHGLTKHKVLLCSKSFILVARHRFPFGQSVPLGEQEPGG